MVRQGCTALCSGPRRMPKPRTAGRNLQQLPSGFFGLHIHGAVNPPHRQSFFEVQPFITAKVMQGEQCLARGATRTVSRDGCNWDEMICLPSPSGSSSSDTDVLPEHWDPSVVVVQLEVWISNGTARGPAAFNHILLSELIDQNHMYVIMWGTNDSPVFSNEAPHFPTKIELSVHKPSVPAAWPAPDPVRSFPRHIFMMTRGTRGDVQPFVALARGLAELHGYLVTICTELRWKSFVLSNSKTTNGKIMFRPSGGDTEKYMGTHLARWATQHTSEIVQISMMAASEAFFFESTTVFLDHVMTFEEQGQYQPVDLIVYGFTVAGIALTVGEYCKKPICGFILQPSCIPSKSKDWSAVVSIETHQFVPVMDQMEQAITSHAALGTLKKIFESNPFQEWNLTTIRKVLKLPPVNTWATLKELESPIVIPIHPNTFDKPSDWWSGIQMTDFIFLRSPSPASGAAFDFAEPLKSFIDEAHQRGSKLCVVSFSSMRVNRRITLKVCSRMAEFCKFNASIIYVGKKFDDAIPQDVLSKAEELTRAKRFLELEQAPFDQLFKVMDCFVVHGGLGTTVEALRLNKPVAVTGPLLMDQRFWGGVVHHKGVGPEAQHIDVFKHQDHCVAFIDNALDPLDPCGWQKNARNLDFGADGADGVQVNADYIS
eukprot:CAMPEP_0194544704 /NCGR_PEP_ID=MMETSP0253-20130528/87995_1 /TAXON_ID=2966 /ORGANISM="Noctiluca scintillans" /LENGTH=656 /DNA_ID=CAMNT_0039391619 /DNA_START=74 /DNA_END=2041 /DNA_ORIENTATION=+